MTAPTGQGQGPAGCAGGARWSGPAGGAHGSGPAGGAHGSGPAGGPAPGPGSGPAGSFDACAEVFDRLGELIGGPLRAYLEGVLHQRGGRAVDLGCGTGRHVAVLAGRYREVLGVDLSEQMLELARRHHAGPGVRFARRDLRDLRPDLDGRFDLVISAHTLHHVEDLDSTLERIRELVAPGGRAVLVDNVAARPAVPRRWFLAEAVRALALDLARRRRPPGEALELYRLSIHPAWLDHLTADRFLSSAEFERRYGRVFPGATFTGMYRARALCWEAPGK
jgi:SAM-dependent methyltransferase